MKKLLYRFIKGKEHEKVTCNPQTIQTICDPLTTEEIKENMLENEKQEVPWIRRYYL